MKFKAFILIYAAIAFGVSAGLVVGLNSRSVEQQPVDQPTAKILDVREYRFSDGSDGVQILILVDPSIRDGKFFPQSLRLACQFHDGLEKRWGVCGGGCSCAFMDPSHDTPLAVQKLLRDEDYQKTLITDLDELHDKTWAKFIDPELEKYLVGSSDAEYWATDTTLPPLFSGDFSQSPEFGQPAEFSVIFEQLVSPDPILLQLKLMQRGPIAISSDGLHLLMGGFSVEAVVDQ